MKQEPKQQLETSFKILVAKLVVSEFRILHSKGIFENLKSTI